MNRFLSLDLYARPNVALGADGFKELKVCPIELYIFSDFISVKSWYEYDRFVAVFGFASSFCTVDCFIMLTISLYWWMVDCGKLFEVIIAQKIKSWVKEKL